MIKKVRLLLLPVLCSSMSLPFGCAVGKFGETNMKDAISAEITGRDKASVVRILGDPDLVASDNGTEYWGYRGHSGWHFHFYHISGGKNNSKELIVEFSGGRATTAYLIDEGSSFGIFAAPLAVGKQP